ncbi:MAG: hypothetical protein RMI79_01700 [Nitrososphaerota archaeon]|nr:hypothetical protein [Nitrososphaerota archaeon]
MKSRNVLRIIDEYRVNRSVCSNPYRGLNKIVMDEPEWKHMSGFLGKYGFEGFRF